jgi:hypothetical protein
MKYKSIFLLLIFSCSLIPLNSVQAEEQITRSIYEANALLYLSEAILLDEDLDENTTTTGLHSPVFPSRSMDIRGRLIDQMINATKKQRNDHDQKCLETAEIYRQQGKTCEADQTDAYCKQRNAELTNKIALLREVRGGDNRNTFTRAWHGLKRTGAKFWHRIGPLGRKFLREVGPEALKIVTIGGPGAEALLKKLLKNTVKNIGRQHIKQIGLSGLQRLLKIQFDVATAAGIDICNSEEEVSEETETDESEELTTEEEEESSLGVFMIDAEIKEASSNMDWEDFLPGCYRHQAYGGGAFYKFEIDLDEGTFTGTASGIGESEEGGWHGWGVYSVDGISGTVNEDPSGSGYLLEGTGHVDLTYRLEAWCPNEMGGQTVFTEDQKPLSGTATVKGNFFVMSDTWYLTINIIFIEGPARFHASCYSCELFPWEP